MEKDFDAWSARKREIHEGAIRRFYREREVWWCALGVNVGFEQDGVGDNFERPVVIIQRINKYLFLGAALTSRKKEGEYYFPVGKIGNKDAVVILSQLRVMDVKRLIYRMAMLDAPIFEELKSALYKALFRTAFSPPLTAEAGPKPLLTSLYDTGLSCQPDEFPSIINPMNVRIKRLEKDLPLPEYHTAGAAGFDLRARAAMTIAPGEVAYVPLNVVIETPPDHFLLIAARGSTHKRGLMLANAVGIGDSDYCGDGDEYKAALWNYTDKPVAVERGDRIAEGIFIKFSRGEWEEVETMGNKTRGGFGSTGKR